MTDVPSTTLNWATDTINEVKIVNDAPVIVGNKQAPPQDFLDSGLLYRQNLPRPFFNWFMDLVCSWVNNISERTSAVGQVFITTDSGIDVAAMATKFGGTWAARGAQNIGTITGASVFERVA